MDARWLGRLLNEADGTRSMRSIVKHPRPGGFGGKDPLRRHALAPLYATTSVPTRKTRRKHPVCKTSTHAPPSRSPRPDSQARRESARWVAVEVEAVEARTTSGRPWSRTLTIEEMTDLSTVRAWQCAVYAGFRGADGATPNIVNSPVE